MMAQRSFLDGALLDRLVQDALKPALRDRTNLPSPTIESVAVDVGNTMRGEVDNAQPKPAVNSTTVWGGIAGVVTGAAQAWLAFQTGDHEFLYTAAMSTVAGIVAIYGRIRAQKTIG
jgi:hypothetical protein